MTLPVLFDGRSGVIRRHGGWERYARELMHHLAGEIHVTPTRPPRHQLTSIAWEWTVLPARARKYELVHFPSYPPTPVVRGRVLYTLHDLVWMRYPQWQSRGGRLYYRHLARQSLGRVELVAGSHAIAAELAEQLDVTAHVIPYGVHPLPEVPPEVRDRPYLLTVGAIEPRKNLPALVEGYRASGLAGEVDLVLVGRHAWGDLPDGVVHAGPVDDNRLAALYGGATAVVSASLYEGFGLPVAEALAAGAPVVCSDIPSFREVTGGDARMFDPRSTSSIAEALVDAARGLPKPAEHFRTRWSWERNAAEHLALYKQLLG